MLQLTDKRAELPMNYKILFKHMADAVPLIRTQLLPFKDYTQLPDFKVQRDERKNALHLQSSGIHTPGTTNPLRGWAKFYIDDVGVVWAITREWACIVTEQLEDLKADDIARIFCDGNTDLFVEAFTALSNYHEAKRHLDPLF